MSRKEAAVIAELLPLLFVVVDDDEGDSRSGGEEVEEGTAVAIVCLFDSL